MLLLNHLPLYFSSSSVSSSSSSSSSHSRSMKQLFEQTSLDIQKDTFNCTHKTNYRDHIKQQVARRQLPRVELSCGGQERDLLRDKSNNSTTGATETTAPTSKSLGSFSLRAKVEDKDEESGEEEEEARMSLLLCRNRRFICTKSSKVSNAADYDNEQKHIYQSLQYQSFFLAYLAELKKLTFCRRHRCRRLQPSILRQFSSALFCCCCWFSLPILILIILCTLTQQTVANSPIASSYRLVLGEYPPQLPVAQQQQPLVAQSSTMSWPDNKTMSLSAQTYLQRRNFGKRLQLNLTEAVLARTLRQLNALTNATTNNNNNSWTGNVTSGASVRQDGQVNEQEQQQVTRRDFISNLLKYRLLRPNSLLGDTWANLTGRVHQNVSHWTTGSGGAANATHHFDNSNNSGGWLEPEESTPMVSVVKPQVSTSHTSNSSANTTSVEAARDYLVVALDKQPLATNRNSTSQTATTQPQLNQSHHWLNTAAATAAAQQPHWQESNIDQVISVKKHQEEQALDGHVEGGGNELKHAAQAAKSGSGERLKEDEKSSFWKKQRHGEEQQAGSGKKDAKEGAKFVKDLGHNKHGWKNVYHKEEYAQHQKFHDVFRDKNWDDKKAKIDEKYHFKKGNKFNDTKSDLQYDKDKHGSKYDYSKNDNWKRYEDDQYDNGSDEAIKETGKKLDDWELDSPLAHQHQHQHHQQQQQSPPAPPEQPSEQQALLYSPHSEVNEDSEQPHQQEQQQHIGSDDAVIEQMKDKLERLSAQTQQQYSGMTPSGAESENSQQVAGSSDDYDGSDWSTGAESAPTQPKAQLAPTSNSHQSVNEIVKTAKRVSKQQQQQQHQHQPLQQLGGAGYSEPIIIRNNSSTSSESQHSSSPTNQQQQQHHLTSSDSSDDEGESDFDSPPEKAAQPMKQNSSRKNELRLKLELDLGRSIAQRAQGNSTNNRRNQQVQQQISQQQNNHHHQPRAKSESRDAHRQHQQQSGNSSWFPKEQDSGKVMRDTSRPNQQARQKQLPTRDPAPQTSVNSPSKQGSSPAALTSTRGHNNNAQNNPQNNSGGLVAKPAAGNQGNQLNNLAQVLPSRPIFVKHLQMNGGVVLGKLNGFSNNRTIEHQLSPTPAVIGDEVSVENPFGGDMITLPGYNQLQVQPQLVESPAREYMLVFGGGGGAGAGEQQAAASGVAVSQHHLLEDEPNVIFEASALNHHQHQVEPRPSFATADYHETLPDLESLMSEHQGRYSMAANGQLIFSAAHPNAKQVMQPNQLSHLTQHHQQQQTFIPKPLVSPQDQNAISNLLKLANSFNYSSSLINNGPSIGGNIVAPTMQQAISRFLRFPRVFSSSSSNYKPPYSQHLKTQESRPSLSFTKLVAESFRPLRGLSVMSHRQPKHNHNQQQQQSQQHISQFHQNHKMQQQHQQQQQISTDDLLEAASKGVPVTSIQPIIIAAASLPPPARPSRENSNGDSNGFKSSSTSPSSSQPQSQQATNNDNERKKVTKINKKKKKRVKKSGQHQKSTTDYKANKSKGKPIRFESNFNLANDHTRHLPVQWSVDEQSAQDSVKAAESSLADHVNYLNQQQITWLNPPTAATAEVGAASHTKLMLDAINVQAREPVMAGTRIRTTMPQHSSSGSSANSPSNQSQQHQTTSTRTPNFGERILKSFKSKLTMSGKTPDFSETSYD